MRKHRARSLRAGATAPFAQGRLRVANLTVYCSTPLLVAQQTLSVKKQPRHLPNPRLWGAAVRCCGWKVSLPSAHCHCPSLTRTMSKDVHLRTVRTKIETGCLEDCHGYGLSIGQLDSCAPPCPRWSGRPWAPGWLAILILALYLGLPCSPAPMQSPSLLDVTQSQDNLADTAWQEALTWKEALHVQVEILSSGR